MIQILRKRIFKRLLIILAILFTYMLMLSIIFPNPEKISVDRSRRTGGSFVQDFQVQDFQKIGNGPHKLYVYSAYCVNPREGEPCYIIVLAGLLSKMKPIFCQLYSEEGNHFHTVKATLKALKTDDLYYDLPYVPYYIFCGTNEGKEYQPAFVSIVESKIHNENVTNFLPIKYNDNTEKYKFAMCVQPTFEYDDPMQFVEWTEYYKLMGVQKFSMYNMSIGPMTSCLIKSYGNLFEIKPWTSPYEDEIEIRVNGQFIASHDCLTRYKGVAEYLVVVDLDEMIMPAPLIGDNYTEMIATLHHSLNIKNIPIEDVAGYTFTTRFFFDFYENDQTIKFWTIEGNMEAENILKKLVLSRKNVYTKYTNSYRPNKYIVVPDKAVEIAAHSIVQGTGRARSVNVPFEMAYNHHYRMCRVGNNGNINQVRLCKNGKRSNDSSGQRFGKRIAINVADRLYNKAKECNIDKTF